MPTVRILEVTVRDGGYQVDHDWGIEDVATLVSLLDAAGLQYVEVGHGTGVGRDRYPAESQPQPPAALTDEEQMRIARAASTRARVGVVCVPGPRFMPIDEVDRIADLGMDFLRFAVMPGDVGPVTLAYVERARARGLTVALNLMQTYARTPAEVARIAADAARAGAHWFYVVDSAGGMEPSEVAAYVGAVRAEAPVEVGLHAHNNAGLAVANCLAAVRAGATLLDTSLNGIGRATGNPPTEQILLALHAMEQELGVDLDAVARAGGLARSLFGAPGTDPIDYVSGSARVHSRNVPGLRRAAAARGIPASHYVVEVGRQAMDRGELGRLEFTDDLLDRAAARCRPAAPPARPTALIDLLAARLDPEAAAARACHDLAVRAAKAHKRSALHLVPAELLPFRGVLPWESERLVGATIAWRAGRELAPPPSMLLRDPGVPASAAPGAVVAPWRAAWLEAIALTAAACAARIGAGPWLVDDGNGVAGELTALLRGLGAAPTLERPGPAPVALVAAGPNARMPPMAAGDLVIVAAGADQARAIADAAEARGAIAVLPALAPALARRIQAQVDAADALADALGPGRRAGDGLVELPRAPRTGEAIVDLDLAAVIDAPDGEAGRAEAARRLAGRRVELLAAGTTRL